MKRRNVERLFYLITTGVLMITLWGTVIVTSDNYMELLEVNETLLDNNDTLQNNNDKLQEENLQLMRTIDTNRVNYNSNLENMREEMTYYKGMYYDLYNKYREMLDSGKFTLSKKELDLLVKCVETEAGVGNLESQRYITQVIINRLNSSEFPNNIVDIIYQKSRNIPQFSVAYDGAMDKCNPQDETYVNVMTALLLGTELPEYVLYFHSDSVKRNWVNTLNIYTVIQGTVFAYDERSINNE